MTERLTREEIIAALLALEKECTRRSITGEICIYGGAAMVLVFDARNSTRDVDAVFRPASELREAARIVAEDLGLPIDWLNDGVKGFLSHHEDLSGEPVLELEGLSNLRLVWPTAEYLLAMKCMAARSEETASDRNDVEFLIRSLRLPTNEEVMEIVERFYPPERIAIKTRYFVSEIISGLETFPTPGREASS